MEKATLVKTFQTYANTFTSKVHTIITILYQNNKMKLKNNNKTFAHSLWTLNKLVQVCFIKQICQKKYQY